MPDQQQIFAGSVEAAPKNYTLAGNTELLLRAVNATFTDNGAASDWLPAVELISDSGHVIARAVDQGVIVTAGDDAEVSWFPGVKHAAGAASSATPAASAYLWTQSAKTFTGNVGFAATWDHFQTTDLTVFGTNPFSTFTVPPTNAAGNVNLMCLQAGAYVVETSAFFAAGTTNFAAQVNLPRADYLDDGGATTPSNLASATAAVGGANALMAWSMKAFTVTPGDTPGAAYLAMAGVGAVAYTASRYSMVCHYLGGGIGNDDFVY